MLTIITQIILCLIAASVLGFIIGWIFSALIKNEKHQNQILAVRERFDEQKEQINQQQTDIDGKDRELMILKEEYATVQREMLSYSMDNEKEPKISQLNSENKMLLAQIKEQKICEDENDLLKLEIQELEIEKQSLIENIEELNEFKASYKDNIHRIAELESNQKKLKKPILTPKNISEQICDDQLIVDDKDLNQRGIKEYEISQIIKDIFLEQKRDSSDI